MLDSIVAELLGHIEPQGAVLVVQAALVLIAQRGVRAVDLLEALGRCRVIGVFVRVVLERQPPARGELQLGWAREPDTLSAITGMGTPSARVPTPLGPGRSPLRTGRPS